MYKADIVLGSGDLMVGHKRLKVLYPYGVDITDEETNTVLAIWQKCEIVTVMLGMQMLPSAYMSAESSKEVIIVSVFLQKSRWAQRKWWHCLRSAAGKQHCDLVRL